MHVSISGKPKGHASQSRTLVLPKIEPPSIVSVFNTWILREDFKNRPGCMIPLWRPRSMLCMRLPPRSLTVAHFYICVQPWSTKGVCNKGASKQKAPWGLQNYNPSCCRLHLGDLAWKLRQASASVGPFTSPKRHPATIPAPEHPDRALSNVQSGTPKLFWGSQGSSRSQGTPETPPKALVHERPGGSCEHL